MMRRRDGATAPSPSVSGLLVLLIAGLLALLDLLLGLIEEGETIAYRVLHVQHRRPDAARLNPETLDNGGRRHDVGGSSLGDESVLGLSLTKILFTILIIVVVWKGFGLVNQLARERQAELGRRAGQPPARSSVWRRQRTVDLVPCPRCGAYVDPGKGCSCGQPAG